MDTDYCDITEYKIPTPPQISKEELLKLTDCPIKKVGLDEWKHYESKLSWLDEVNILKGLMELVKSGNKAAAEKLVCNRRHHEYEDFEIEETEN